MWTLSSFYHSKDWEAFREVIINERTREDGLLYDEITGQPILKRYDVILHHSPIELTEENVNDRTISLNPENIKIVSHRTHNQLHERFKKNFKGRLPRREVYLIYGSPCSGKSTYLESVRMHGDLILDIDRIRMCVSGNEQYDIPKGLSPIIFGIRDYMLDAIKVKQGFWDRAYIIGGFPLYAERERIKRMTNAEEIFIDTPKIECMRRLHENPSGRDIEAWERYISEWWERYTPPVVVKP